MTAIGDMTSLWVRSCSRTTRLRLGALGVVEGVLLSPSTVAFHVRDLAKKLGASNSTELVGLVARRRATEGAPPKDGT